MCLAREEEFNDPYTTVVVTDDSRLQCESIGYQLDIFQGMDMMKISIESQISKTDNASDNARIMVKKQEELANQLLDIYPDDDLINIRNYTSTFKEWNKDYNSSAVRLKFHMKNGYVASVIYVEPASYGMETCQWELMFYHNKESEKQSIEKLDELCDDPIGYLNNKDVLEIIDIFQKQAKEQ